jgi:hypothetical protein
LPSPEKRQRATTIVVLGAAIAWQVYVVVSAFRRAPDFQKLFTGLGGPLPAVTRFLFATYPWWWLIPVFFTILSIDVVRQRDPPLRYFAVVTGSAILTGFVLCAWLYEAFFQPLNSILDAIG